MKLKYSFLCFILLLFGGLYIWSMSRIEKPKLAELNVYTLGKIHVVKGWYRIETKDGVEIVHFYSAGGKSFEVVKIK